MTQRIVVLSSGGIDSTICLAMAVKAAGAENVLSVSFFYGQKHAKELESAEKVADYYGVAHKVLSLDSIFTASDCALLAGSARAVPHASYKEQKERAESDVVATYVPFRNGLMLSAAASYALGFFKNEPFEIWLGAHADDVSEFAYADCTPEFLSAMNAALSSGTYGRVTLAFPLGKMTKAGVVKEGLGLKVPYELTWSCYEGGETPCHECATCIDREKAFIANGSVDPLAVKGR